ncbi:MAG: ribbon-helix-helix domain-containing protein [Desulfuromusa sp.]
MQTVQMTLDEDLIKKVDDVAKKLHTNRSAFTRKALSEALVRYNQEQLEYLHHRGYEQHPVTTDEFSLWETEQSWGDK